MNKKQEKVMMQKAHEYASKQGDMEYESSKEDFIEGYKQAFALYHVVERSEQLVCPHQGTRTPNEEKTGKCRQCGRSIKAN